MNVGSLGNLRPGAWADKLNVRIASSSFTLREQSNNSCSILLPVHLLLAMSAPTSRRRDLSCYLLSVPHVTAADGHFLSPQLEYLWYHCRQALLNLLESAYEDLAIVNPASGCGFDLCNQFLNTRSHRRDEIVVIVESSLFC